MESRTTTPAIIPPVKVLNTVDGLDPPGNGSEVGRGVRVGNGINGVAVTL